MSTLDQVGAKIKQARQIRNCRQIDLANALGVQRATISMWEAGKRNPLLPNLEAIADYLNLPMGYFLSEEDHKRLLAEDYEQNLRDIGLDVLHIKKLPILGRIGAGEPLLASMDNPEGELPVPETLNGTFGLTVGGDSMQPTVMLNDYVIIHAQPDVEDGEIAAVQITEHDTSEAVLKRIHHIDGGLLLISDNPKYPPRMIRFGAYSKVEILGKAVSFIRSL